MQFPCKFTTPHTGYKFLQWAPGQNAWHPGMDFNYLHGNEDIGNPVHTICKSKIEYVSPPPTRANNFNGGYGLFVVLYHPGLNLWSKYAHLKSVEPIPWGLELYEGVKFAEVGRSGTTYAHLHMEIFGKEMHDLQKNHSVNGVTLPFRFYPSGKSISYVKKYYINPVEFMENLMPSNWAVESWLWAAENGIISDKSVPRANITYEQFIVLLHNYNKKFNK